MANKAKHPAAGTLTRGRRRLKATPANLEISGAQPLLTIGGKPVKLERLRFGSVTFSAPKADHVIIERNIAAGQAALERGTAVLKSPGVKLATRKGTALYTVDPKHPEHLVRIVNGKRQRGVFEGGEFKSLD